MVAEDIYLTIASISWEKHSMIRDVNLYSDDIKPYILNKGIKNQKTTSSKKKRKSHTNQRNGNQCEICAKSFTSKENLQQHMDIHTGIKPRRCDVCQLSFTTSTKLKIHKRTHTGKKLYSCDMCKKSFAQKSNLDVHIRAHTGIKYYSCDICY